MGWPGVLFGVLRHPIFLLLAAVGLCWALISVNNEGYQGPPEKPESNIVATVTLAVLDGDNGAVKVLNAQNSSEVRVYGPGEGSFLRGVIRTLVRERASRNIQSDPTFDLELTERGGLILVDQTTGYWIAIEAFGPTSYNEFRAIFDRAHGGVAASLADR